MNVEIVDCRNLFLFGFGESFLVFVFVLKSSLKQKQFRLKRDNGWLELFEFILIAIREDGANEGRRRNVNGPN